MLGSHKKDFTKCANKNVVKLSMGADYVEMLLRLGSYYFV